MKKLLLVLFILTLQCGFEIVNEPLNNFSIERINTEGYNKVNFLVKNDLLNKNTNSLNNKSIQINIKTVRDKEVSEKNIQNEVTKYKVSLKVNVEIISNDNKRTSFNIIKKGDFRVGNTSLKTSKNQDNLEKLLSNEIAYEIKQKLLFLKNDI